MRVVLLFVTVTVLGLQANISGASATSVVSTNDVLVIDRCSTGVAGGKCTLILSPLRPAGDFYCGDYATKVSPYFFKNEDGKVTMLITRESIDKACNGSTVEITGTATQNGKNRKTLHIDATATPLDGRQGTLRLRFLAGDREMVFDTRYKFVAPE